MKEEALKLADEIFNYLPEYDAKPFADMIRKLVAELDKYQGYWKDCEEERTEKCSDCQKQGEPVVYWDGKHFASKEKSSLADIPLYTAPQTKPLSDVTEALKMMVEEFKQLDLPYGSKAYAKATEVLRSLKHG